MPLFNKINEFHPGFLASLIYPLYDGAYNVATAVSAVDTIYLYPFVVPHTLSFASIKMRVITGGAASSVKSAIWADSPVSHRPLGAPLFSDNTGQATTANNTTITTAMAAGILNPNTLYWFGSKYTGTLPVMWNASGSARLAWLSGMASVGYQHTFADAYANSMPTFSEGASFTSTTGPTPVPFAQT